MTDTPETNDPFYNPEGWPMGEWIPEIAQELDVTLPDGMSWSHWNVHSRDERKVEFRKRLYERGHIASAYENGDNVPGWRGWYWLPIFGPLAFIPDDTESIRNPFFAW